MARDETLGRRGEGGCGSWEETVAARWILQEVAARGSGWRRDEAMEAWWRSARSGWIAAAEYAASSDASVGVPAPGRGCGRWRWRRGPNGPDLGRGAAVQASTGAGLAVVCAAPAVPGSANRESREFIAAGRLVVGLFAFVFACLQWITTARLHRRSAVATAEW